MGRNMNYMTLAQKCDAGGAGTKFWIGLCDTYGNIYEVHKYEEAQRCDFHTDFYFSKQAVVAEMENENISYFWMNKPGVIEIDKGFGAETVIAIKQHIK